MHRHRLPGRVLLAALVALGLLLPRAAVADDTDIYLNTSVLPQQQSLTFLALDLNLSNPRGVLCDNVLLGTTPNCLALRQRINLNKLLSSLGIPMVGNLAGAPALVPLIDPNVPLSDLSSTQTLLVGTYLDAITAFFNSLPKPSPGIPDVTNPTQVTEQRAYLLAIIDIVTSFATARAKLSILLNHDDIGGVTRNPATMTVNGTTPATGCAFQDASSLGGSRVNTVGCSDGAYVFAGITDLLDPVALQALLLRLVTSLTGPLPSTQPCDAATSPAPCTPTTPTPQAPNGLSAAHPYQTKEIYAELARYLRGDQVFNGHLGYYDYGDREASNNVDQTTPPLAWDKSIETDNNYRSALAANPKACTINLVHLQTTNAARQEESNALLANLFPFADVDNSRTVTVPELADTAATDGLAYGSDRRLINSLFVVQEALTDATTLTQRGQSVVSFTDTLNLLGRGQGIAAALVKSLVVDTTLGSIVTGASRTEANGTTNAAYLTLFRPEKNQKPAWYGNLKRLRLLPSSEVGKGFTVVDANYTSGAASSAIAPDGRIRNGALTLWTDSTKLGGLAADGRKTDLGGAGQRIPGFQFGGGGNPGRGGTGSARTLYYDSSTSGAFNLAALNADDTGVRSELLAATGAAAVTLPDPNCAANCTAARTARDEACNATGAFTQACASENTQCLSSCSSNNYTAICNNQLAACTAACPAGLAGTTCRATCTTQNLSCTATQVVNCNGGCSAALMLCPDTKRNMCLADSATQDATCRVACQTTRSADTVVRELLLYARGYDVGTRVSSKGTGPAASPTNSGVSGRPWLMGAVLHSRPVAINYGNGKIRVVVGSADGVLHMIDDATGVENWGFMPQAVMGQLATLRENESGAALPYGVDGSPVVLIRDRGTSGAGSAGDGVINSTNDRVLLFFGLRRGGSAYYALDITNPDVPKLQWRLSSEGLRAKNGEILANSAQQFGELGLTFSTPQIARLRCERTGLPCINNAASGTRSVLIFGGGYNGGRNSGGGRIGKDLNNSRATAPVSQVGKDDGSGSSNRGNALYMIDAETGELLWRSVRGAALGGYTSTARTYSQPMLVDSIASDTTVLDTDNDGFVDRLYVGDTGGRLWRADFASVSPSDWTFGPVASVGRQDKPNSLADDRRIFAAPDYVPLRDALTNQGKDLVLFGTGDREDVLNLTTVNWLYGFIDTDLISGKSAAEVISSESSKDLAKHDAFTDVTNQPLTNLSKLTAGYKLRFDRKGEKMFSTPVTLNNTVTFSTYIPPDPVDPDTPICVPSEGAARLYKINAQTTTTRNKTAARDEALPKPGLPGEISVLAGTAQSVGNEVYSLDAKEVYRASWRERLGETQK